MSAYGNKNDMMDDMEVMDMDISIDMKEPTREDGTYDIFKEEEEEGVKRISSMNDSDSLKNRVIVRNGDRVTVMDFTEDWYVDGIDMDKLNINKTKIVYYF